MGIDEASKKSEFPFIPHRPEGGGRFPTLRKGARIDTVTGSPWSRDINVNGKEKRQGEDRRREYEVRPESFNEEDRVG